MKEFWNERYGKDAYAYGKEPNAFFAEELKKVVPGTIVLPGEGEGRNAVYAAKLGWYTYAMDISEEAKKKALNLAKEEQVEINYKVTDSANAAFQNNSIDVVAFIYAHFPEDKRSDIHRKAVQWLKPGGKIILEAFNPKQIDNDSGGPKDEAMLYSTDMLISDFKNMEMEVLVEMEVELTEGEFHKGKADVIRMIATKS